MKLPSLKSGLAAIAVALLAVGVAVYGTRQRDQPPREAAADQRPRAGDRLRFAADAPQLAFIRSAPAGTAPLPASEPLTAKLALAEDHTARISTAVAGRILHLHAEIGDRVAAGAPLATLDSPDYGSAIADLHKAEADAQRKALAHRRAQELLAGEAIARRDAEGAAADWQMAAAEAERARLRLANLGPRGTASGERLILRAPFAATVVDRQANPGSEARPDQAAPLFVVSDLGRLWVLVDVPERLASRIRTGEPLLVAVDAFPGETFRASITRVAPQLDPNVRRVQIRAEIANADGRLRPEMFARVQLADPRAAAVIRLPTTAVVTDGLYPVVFVEGQRGAFTKQRVHIAFQDAESVWLDPTDGGLQAGARVVTGGAMLLASELATGN